MPKERETPVNTAPLDIEALAFSCECGWRTMAQNRSKCPEGTSAHSESQNDYRLPKWLVLILGLSCIAIIGFLVRRNS